MSDAAAKLGADPERMTQAILSYLGVDSTREAQEHTEYQEVLKKNNGDKVLARRELYSRSINDRETTQQKAWFIRPDDDESWDSKNRTMVTEREGVRLLMPDGEYQNVYGIDAPRDLKLLTPVVLDPVVITTNHYKEETQRDFSEAELKVEDHNLDLPEDALTLEWAFDRANQWNDDRGVVEGTTEIWGSFAPVTAILEVGSGDDVTFFPPSDDDRFGSGPTLKVVAYDEDGRKASVNLAKGKLFDETCERFNLTADHEADDWKTSLAREVMAASGKLGIFHMFNIQETEERDDLDETQLARIEEGYEMLDWLREHDCLTKWKSDRDTGQQLRALDMNAVRETMLTLKSQYEDDIERLEARIETLENEPELTEEQNEQLVDAKQELREAKDGYELVKDWDEQSEYITIADLEVYDIQEDSPGEWVLYYKAEDQGKAPWFSCHEYRNSEGQITGNRGGGVTWLSRTAPDEIEDETFEQLW